MNKSVFVLLPLALSIVGCGQGSRSGGKVVDIKSISARAIDEGESPAAKKSRGIVKKANDTEGNYALIRKGETEIRLTVKLDNPKGEGIDALEISCDDKGAKILVDGEYKDIGVSSGGRVVNWAQEDPYEKTFFIQTTSDDPLNVIKINDIKVNGAWQKSDLSNNELEVYKLGDNELKKTFVTNTPNFYECKFDIGEAITNFTVDGATNTGDNHYKVTSNGKMSYSFDYTYQNKKIHWSESVEVSLLIMKPSDLFPVTCFVDADRIWVGNLDLSGTDVYDNLFLKCNDDLLKLSYNSEYTAFKISTVQSFSSVESSSVDLFVGSVAVLENIPVEQ